MALQSNGYQFKPHELPFITGSPATPDHHRSRRLAYMAIGLFLLLSAGLQNGLLTASMNQIRGDLALDLLESGWVQVAYYMSYSTISVLFFKIRQNFDLQVFIRYSLMFTLLGNALQLFFYTYEVAIIARFMIGIGTGGLFTLSMYYGMQAVSGIKRLHILLMFSGVLAAITTLCQMLMPFFFADGNTQEIFIWQFGMVLISIGLILALPLPPNQYSKTLTLLDIVNYLLYATGIALLAAFLILGRTVWWTTDWLGILLACSIVLIGGVFFTESKRKNPLIDWQWISTQEFIMLLAISLVMRVYTAEQSVGASGLLTALGMSNEQLMSYYLVIFISALAGIWLGVKTIKMTDIRRNLVISTLGIAIGAFLDTHISSQTRAEQLYLSQAIIAFSSFYFSSAIMMEGMMRAISVSTNHIISFIAVLAVAQNIGGLMGAAGFSAYVTIQTNAHLLNLSQSLTMTDPTVALAVQQGTAQLGATISDVAQRQAFAVSEIVRQANLEATVLAYRDLFEWVWILSSITFFYFLSTWAYRRYKKINILEKELGKVMQAMNPATRS